MTIYVRDFYWFEMARNYDEVRKRFFWDFFLFWGGGQNSQKWRGGKVLSSSCARARVRACLAVAEFCETLPIPLRQKFSFFQKEKNQSRCMRMQTGTHMVLKHPWMWQARIRDDTHELVQNMLGADGGRRGPPWANPWQGQLLYTHTHTNTHTHTHYQWH